MTHIASDTQQKNFDSIHTQAALLSPVFTSISLDVIFEALRKMHVATVSGFCRVPAVLGMPAMVMSHREGNTVLLKSVRGWVLIGPNDKLHALLFDDIRDGDHMVLQTSAA